MATHKSTLTIDQMRDLRERGASYAAIARLAGVSTQRVQFLLKQDPCRIPNRAGRPRKNASPLPMEALHVQASKHELFELVNSIERNIFPETYELAYRIAARSVGNTMWSASWDYKRELVHTLIRLSRLSYALKLNLDPDCNTPWILTDSEVSNSNTDLLTLLNAQLPQGWEAIVNSDPDGHAIRVVNPFNWCNTRAKNGWSLG